MIGFGKTVASSQVVRPAVVKPGFELLRGRVSVDTPDGGDVVYRGMIGPGIYYPKQQDMGIVVELMGTKVFLPIEIASGKVLEWVERNMKPGDFLLSTGNSMFLMNSAGDLLFKFGGNNRLTMSSKGKISLAANEVLLSHPGGAINISSDHTTKESEFVLESKVNFTDELPSFAIYAGSIGEDVLHPYILDDDGADALKEAFNYDAELPAMSDEIKEITEWSFKKHEIPLVVSILRTPSSSMNKAVVRSSRSKVYLYDGGYKEKRRYTVGWTGETEKWPPMKYTAEKRTMIDGQSLETFTKKSYYGVQDGFINKNTELATDPQDDITNIQYYKVILDMFTKEMIYNVKPAAPDYFIGLNPEDKYQEFESADTGKTIKLRRNMITKDGSALSITIDIVLGKIKNYHPRSVRGTEVTPDLCLTYFEAKWSRKDMFGRTIEDSGDFFVSWGGEKSDYTYVAQGINRYSRIGDSGIKNSGESRLLYTPGKYRITDNIDYWDENTVETLQEFYEENLPWTNKTAWNLDQYVSYFEFTEEGFTGKNIVYTDIGSMELGWAYQGKDDNGRPKYAHAAKHSTLSMVRADSLYWILRYTINALSVLGLITASFFYSDADAEKQASDLGAIQAVPIASLINPPSGGGKMLAQKICVTTQTGNLCFWAAPGMDANYVKEKLNLFFMTLRKIDQTTHGLIDPDMDEDFSNISGNLDNLANSAAESFQTGVKEAISTKDTSHLFLPDPYEYINLKRKMLFKNINPKYKTIKIGETDVKAIDLSGVLSLFREFYRGGRYAESYVSMGKES